MVESGTRLHNQVLDFLIAEARLLDHNHSSRWFALLAEDLHYRLPVRRTVRRREGLGFDPVMTHFHDDYTSMELRIRRLGGENAWSEDPPSRTRRFVSNVQVQETEIADEFAVNSYLMHTERQGRHPVRPGTRRARGPAMPHRRRVQDRPTDDLHRPDPGRYAELRRLPLSRHSTGAVLMSDYGLRTASTTLGSAGPITFGPDGIVFLADTVSARILARRCRRSGWDPGPVPFDLEPVDVRIGSFLGCDAEDITINDIAVHPTSHNVYLSVQRGRGPVAAGELAGPVPGFEVTPQAGRGAVAGSAQGAADDRGGRQLLQRGEEEVSGQWRARLVGGRWLARLLGVL